ncbi:MAG: prolyl-tRNA synthetase associated domain-containing protein [Alphaproteobacteria bacterium]|nr:prolyl-tRNA synthetase associated domain-containing protein [Alphaproteobacteria bacterium]
MTEAPASHATPDQLLARLEALGLVTHTVKHKPVFTVEESKVERGSLPGGHCKSLFLRDKKERMFLVVAFEDRRIDLKKLSDLIGSARLSFGSADRLMRVLGVIPGSVTPFALINDRQRQVDVVLDADMMRIDPLNYHPLSNDMTTAISPAGLLSFIADCGHRPRILDLSPATIASAS